MEQQRKTKDQILRMKDVMEVTGMSKSTLYRWIQEGQFPKPIMLGSRATGWKSSTVDTWIANREVQHDN